MSDLVIPNRVLVRRSYNPGSGESVAQVCDLFSKMEALKDPKDLIMPSQRLHVEFKEGRMFAGRITPGGVQAGEYLFTRVGARTLSTKILPPRGFGTLRHLAAIDGQGEKLATLAWAKFASALEDDSSMVRTVNANVNGKPTRVIRSVHSSNYAPYSNLEFLRAVLDFGQHFAKCEVIHYAVTDEVMRVRLRGEETNGLVPVVELWNSEVGQRSVVLSSGLYNLRTESVVAHWASTGSKTWIHRGNPDRIAKELQAAFSTMFKAADDIRDMYVASLDAAIDDAVSWLEGMLDNRLGLAQIKAAKDNLVHASVTKGGKVATLVDAVSLVGAHTSDPEEAAKVEAVAGLVLLQGVRKAKEEAKAKSGVVAPALDGVAA